MKTFKEFCLTEDKHFMSKYTTGTGEWGIVHPSGKVESGDQHPTATNHMALISTHKKLGSAAEYHNHTHDRLSIRTKDKESLGAAIKGFHNLPHNESGYVYHEHADYSGDKPKKYFNYGHKGEVLQNMKNFHSELTEASHFASKWAGGLGTWGIVHPSGRLESGNDHPWAKGHLDLIPNNKPPGDYAYYHLTSSGLNIKTFNKNSLGGTIKSYYRLPHDHDHGIVSHDHDDLHQEKERSDYMSGHKDKILNRMKELHANYRK